MHENELLQNLQRAQDGSIQGGPLSSQAAPSFCDSSIMRLQAGFRDLAAGGDLSAPAIRAGMRSLLEQFHQHQVGHWMICVKAQEDQHAILSMSNRNSAAQIDSSPRACLLKSLRER